MTIHKKNLNLKIIGNFSNKDLYVSPPLVTYNFIMFSQMCVMGL